jgi:hypothetical protein
MHTRLNVHVNASKKHMTRKNEAAIGVKLGGFDDVPCVSFTVKARD